MSTFGAKVTDSHVLTFEDLFAIVGGDDILALTRTKGPRLIAQATATAEVKQRRNQLSALRALVKIIGRCAGAAFQHASAIPCDVAWLNGQLFRLPAKAHGLEERTFGGYVSALRQLLREVGLLDPELGVGLSETGPWPSMLEGLEVDGKDAKCRYGLSRFAAWCDARSIAPDAVTDETLLGFEQHVRTRHLREDIAGYIGGVVKNWRQAASISAAWPAARLTAAPRQQRYRFAIGDFPAQVQVQVVRFEQCLSGKTKDGQPSRGPFRRQGPAKALEDKSVAMRVYGIKQALNAYVEEYGGDPSAVTDLAQLLEPDAFEVIVMFHWNRAVQRRIAKGELDPRAELPPDAGNTTQTYAVAVALIQLAKYVCPLPEEQLEVLQDLARKVHPEPQATISRRNSNILDHLLEPKNRLILLRLPDQLMKEADGMRGRPVRAASLAMTAVLIGFLLTKPLRLKNLTELRLGEELQFTDPRLDRPTRLKISRDMVKNGVDIQWPISERLGNLIAHYVRHHRPHLGPADTAWLFPAQRSPNAARHCFTIRSNIQKAVAKHIGVHMHPHIFRAFMAYLVLEESPGALEDLRQLLDHKSLRTCLTYYAYSKPDEVARRVDEALERGREILVATPPKSSPTGRGRRR